MSSEPVSIDTGTGGLVHVSRFTGPRGEPRIQLDAGAAPEPLALTLDGAVDLVAALLDARQQWLQTASGRRARARRGGELES
jgi:hypothetical protein